MLDLIETYQKNPHIRSISLELKCIKDMTQMVNLLSKFKNLRELSLHGNRLTSIPPLSSIQKLAALDISNNPIKIDNFLLDRLFQIPNLIHLVIDCSKAQEQMIIQHLPRLKTINGQCINRQNIEKNCFEEERTKLADKLKEQMQRIKQVYYRLNDVIQNEKRDSSQEEPFSAGTKQILKKQDELIFLYQDVEEEMAYFYQGLEDKLSCDGVFAYCKNKLTTVLDGLMIKFLDQLGLEQAVKVYEEIARIKAQNFDHVLKVIFTTSYEKHISNELQKPSNRIRKQKLYLNEIFRMKKIVTELKQENTKMDRIATRQLQIQRQPSVKATPRNIELKQRYNPMKKSPSKPLMKSQSKQSMSRSPSKVFNKMPNPTDRNKSPRALSKSPSNLHQRQSKSQLNKIPSKVQLSKQNIGNRNSSRSQQISGNKIQSLEQLLTLIQEIMDQKAKYNNKNFEKKEPYETSQEFLFSFFSRKYGLKEIALDWCLSIIRAIERFCKEDIEVQIFGKILKNHLYEQYYDECKKFRGQIASAFKRERVTEDLEEGKFRGIFTYFFSYQKSETIDKIIKQTQFPITISQAEYFLQSYKLAFEEKELKVFKDLFEQLDSNNEASLTQSQCKTLAKMLLKGKDINQQEKINFTKSVDTMLEYCKKDKYIFSEVFQMMHTIL